MDERKISQEELKDTLEKHKKWLNYEPDGEYANLRNADLSYADLIDADLSYADLSYADLSYANLRGAELSYADLINANLRHADLRNADLRHASLSGADLINANLRHADLTKSNIWDTVFLRVVGKKIIIIQLNTSVNNRVINYIPEIDWVSAGCFHGTLEELKNKVKDVYSDNEKIRKRYEKAIELIEFLKEDTPND